MADDEWLRLVCSPDEPMGTVAHDKLLLEEALDVLAAYRSIGDAKVRHSLRNVIIKTAADYKDAIEASSGRRGSLET